MGVCVIHSVHLPVFYVTEGVEPPTQFSKREDGAGGLAWPQFLEGVAGKEGGDFFQGEGGVAIFT